MYHWWSYWSKQLSNIKKIIKQLYFKKETKKYIKWGFLGLAIIPLFSVLFFINSNSVNVPFLDQYELVPIIKDIHNNSLTFQDLWQQHNEHRIFFPRIVMLASAVISKWDIREGILINWVVATASFVFLAILLRLTARRLSNTVPIWMPLLISLAFFSILQYENWLWGWQVQWFLNVFGIMLATYSITKLIISPKQLLWLATTILGAIIAQYSLGNGMLIWPIIIAVLIYCRIKKKWIGLTVLIASISTLLYYFNYHDPTGSVSKTLVFHEPIQFIGYTMLYLGRPLSYGHIAVAFSGFLILLTFLTIAIFLFVKNKARFKICIPWFMLGFYAIASALITGLSRLGYGAGQSLSSRYTTISTLLLLSLIVLLVLNRDVVKKIFKRLYAPFAIFFVISIFGLVIINAQDASIKALTYTRYINNTKKCTSFLSPTKSCLLSAYPPSEQTAIDRLNYLKKIHWGGY